VRQNQDHKAHTVLHGKTRTAEQYAGLKKQKNRYRLQKKQELPVKMILHCASG